MPLQALNCRRGRGSSSRPPLPLPSSAPCRTSGGGLSTTLPGQAEALGDLRLRYNVNSAEEVSVIGAQAYSTRANATFSSFKTPKATPILLSSPQPPPLPQRPLEPVRDPHPILALSADLLISPSKHHLVPRPMAFCCFAVLPLPIEALTRCSAAAFTGQHFQACSGGWGEELC